MKTVLQWIALAIFFVAVIALNFLWWGIWYPALIH